MNVLRSFRFISMAITALLSLLSINTAVITQIHSLSEVVAYLQGNPEEPKWLRELTTDVVIVEVQKTKPLYVLDVDFTIIRPIDPNVNPQALAKNYKFIKEHIDAQIKFDLRDVILASILLPQQLMEPEEGGTSDVILKLKKHAYIIGLTARPASSLAGTNIPEHTVEVLEGFGISLENPEDPKDVNKSSDAFVNFLLHRGVLFCKNSDDKSKVLKEYIEHIEKTLSISIKDVVMVDDTKGHLESCEKFCSEMGIDFKGFHYTKACSDVQEGCEEESLKRSLNNLDNALKESIKRNTPQNSPVMQAQSEIRKVAHLELILEELTEQ